MNGPVVILLALIATAVVFWLVVEVDAFLDHRAARREWHELTRYAHARRRVEAWQRHPSNRARIGHTKQRENEE